MRNRRLIHNPVLTMSASPQAMQRQDAIFHQHGCQYALVLEDGTVLYAKTEQGADRVGNERDAAVYTLRAHGGEVSRSLQREPLWMRQAIQGPELEVDAPDADDERADDEREGPDTDTDDSDADTEPGITKSDDKRESEKGDLVQPDAKGALMACGVDVRDVVRTCFTTLGLDYDALDPLLKVRFRTIRGTSGFHLKVGGARGRHKISLSLGTDCDSATLWELALHESTHAKWVPELRASRRRRVGVHGLDFKEILCDAAKRMWGIEVSPYTQGRYGCDPLIEIALRDKGFNTHRDVGRNTAATDRAQAKAVYAALFKSVRRDFIEANLSILPPEDLRTRAHRFDEMSSFAVYARDKWNYRRTHSLKWLVNSGVSGEIYQAAYTLRTARSKTIRAEVEVPYDWQVERVLAAQGYTKPQAGKRGRPRKS